MPPQKNKNLKKNGVKNFFFFSTGKQTTDGFWVNPVAKVKENS